LIKKKRKKEEEEFVSTRPVGFAAGKNINLLTIIADSK